MIKILWGFCPHMINKVVEDIHIWAWLCVRYRNVWYDYSLWFFLLVGLKRFCKLSNKCIWFELNKQYQSVIWYWSLDRDGRPNWNLKCGTYREYVMSCTHKYSEMAMLGETDGSLNVRISMNILSFYTILR